jgi:hypothetical protein
VTQARAAAAAGVDFIAAPRTEACGHTGYSTTLPLVPAIIDAVGSIAVVAAGDVADGRGVAAALMLGAKGVWMGSRFVASVEAGEPDWINSGGSPRASATPSSPRLTTWSGRRLSRRLSPTAWRERVHREVARARLRDDSSA